MVNYNPTYEWFLGPPCSFGASIDSYSKTPGTLSPQASLWDSQGGSVLKVWDIPNLPYGFLVGGFNPSEKYSSNWIISPWIGVKKKYLSCHHLVFYYS